MLVSPLGRKPGTIRSQWQKQKAVTQCEVIMMFSRRAGAMEASCSGISVVSMDEAFCHWKNVPQSSEVFLVTDFYFKTLKFPKHLMFSIVAFQVVSYIPE